MKDYRLSFVDEPTWWSAAENQEWVKYEYEPQDPQSSEEPIIKRKWIQAEGIDFDIIGDIYKPTNSTVIFEGKEVPEFAKVPGWHVNVRFHQDTDSLPEALVAHRVTPSNPVRTFAGGWFEGE